MGEKLFEESARMVLPAQPTTKKLSGENDDA